MAEPFQVRFKSPHAFIDRHGRVVTEVTLRSTDRIVMRAAELLCEEAGHRGLFAEAERAINTFAQGTDRVGCAGGDFFADWRKACAAEQVIDPAPEIDGFELVDEIGVSRGR